MTFRERLTKRNSRGATVVEGALVFPVVFLTIFALIGGALYLRTFFALNSATRAGARAASAAGQDPQSDYYVLKAVKKELSSLSSGQLRTIVVYQKPAGSSDPPSQCRSLNAGQSYGAICTAYGPADLNASAATIQARTAWKPINRFVNRTDPPDYVGVYIVSGAGTLNLFGNLTVTRSSVVQIETVYA